MERPIICFAPIQGYTTASYRRAHHQVVGGIDWYYTPFIRWEKGHARDKDLRDVSQRANFRVPTVPQVIARDRDEFAHLCDALQTLGWKRINLNMGCPFPPQTGAGRGSGLLPQPDKVAAILQEMEQRQEVTFSIKMRLGQRNPEEVMQLLPMLNETQLDHIIMHPRVGRQQYKGARDMEAFAKFYEGCQKPIIYNGDITTIADMQEILKAYPGLRGVMIGRGLLSDPTMLIEGLSPEERLSRLLQIHDYFFVNAQSTLQGDSQLLSHLHAFWQYPQGLVPKKTYKDLIKCGSLRTYLAAIASLRQ